MRFIFLLGGFLGFLVAGGVGYAAEHHAGRVLLDAAIGAIAGGMLFRWFWTVMVNGLRETILRRRAAEQAAASAASATTSPSTPTRIS